MNLENIKNEINDGIKFIGDQDTVLKILKYIDSKIQLPDSLKDNKVLEIYKIGESIIIQGSLDRKSIINNK